METVLSRWNNCSNGYIATIVTNEDLTTWAKLSHSMAEQVVLGRMTKAKCRYKPKVEGNLGSKKDDHGVLHIDHPATPF
jgi:hypothetical protein